MTLHKAVDNLHSLWQPGQDKRRRSRAQGEARRAFVQAVWQHHLDPCQCQPSHFNVLSHHCKDSAGVRLKQEFPSYLEYL